MNYPKKVKLIVETLKEHKGKDVEVLNVRDHTPLADYYILCSLKNERQLKALADLTIEKLEENKIEVNHVEGVEASGWILIDAFDVIINLFLEEERKRVSLEELFAKK